MQRPHPFPRLPENADEEEAVEFFTSPGNHPVREEVRNGLTLLITGRPCCRACSPSMKDGCARKPHTSGSHVAAGSDGLIYEVW